MATFRDKVVTVTLNYGATAINETQFDIPLILVGHNVTSDVTNTYTSTDAMVSAGFSVNSAAYKMAKLLFDGLYAPERVIVGKRDITATDFTVGELEDGGVYAITLRQGKTSKTFSYKATDNATVQEVNEGVAKLIQSDATWSAKITVEGTATQILFSPVSGQNITVEGSDNFVEKVQFAQSVLEDITKVAEEDSSFFYVLSESHTSADVLALAGWVEEHDKVYFFSSQDTDIADDVEGNLLVTLGDTGYNNTSLALWTSTADSTFPEAGVVGSICSAQPGTTPLHGKTLVGVTLEKLSTDRESKIVANNGNIYRKEHGLLFYRDGFMVSGLFADYIIHALWFKARLDESLFTLFKQQSMLGSGVRATSSGIALIRQAVTANPIQVGISNGTIANEVVTSSDTGMYVSLKPTVYIPSRADMTTAQINQRLVDGMIVEYVYAGFFHYVKVQVNVLTNRTGTTSSASSSVSTTSS